MELLAIIALWLLAGAAGSFLLAFSWLEELDIDGDDLMHFAITAIAGPITLVVGLLISFLALVARILRLVGFDKDRVYFRRMGR